MGQLGRARYTLAVPHDGLSERGIVPALIPLERMPLALPACRLSDPDQKFVSENSSDQ